MCCVALDRVDQVRHQIMAALQFNINTTEGALRSNARARQRVVDTNTPQNKDDGQDGEHPDKSQYGESDSCTHRSPP